MNKKVLFLGIDAAMPDLIKKFINEGNLPNIKKLVDHGIFSRVETVFPPLTAAGWSAIVTGAGAGSAGIPSLMVKLPGEELDSWHTSFDRNMLLSETLWEVGEKEKKNIALVDWPVTFPLGAISGENSVQVGAALNPPFRYFYMPLWDVASSAVFSTEHLNCNQIPGRAVVVEPKPAEGWTNLPESGVAPLEFEILVPPTYVEGYKMHVLMFGEGSEYNRVIISEEKDASKAVANLSKGEKSEWIIKSFEARDGKRSGRFYLKLMSIAEDGSAVKVYQSAVHTAESYTIPPSLTAKVEEAAGVYMEVDDPWAFMDGWITIHDYLDQLGDHADWWGKATKFTLENTDWDMAFSWVGTIDHIKHIAYGGTVPEASVYEPDMADMCNDAIRTAYKQVDENIGRILEAVDLDNTVVAIVSDHGFTHLDWNPYVKQWLQDEGLLEYVLDLTHDDPSNLTINWENTKCHPLEPCHAHIFINLKGRDPQGSVDPKDYAAVQQQIIRALFNIKNPETGESAVSVAITREEAGALGVRPGAGMDRIGDVVYAWKPGYMSHPFIYRTAVQYRDGTERIIANPELMEKAKLGKNFTGVHLCLPSEPDMHAVMILSGGGMPTYERKNVARIIDIAPTISKILDMPVPKDAEGGVLYDILDRIEE